jgi:hypothetical protein
MGESQSNEGGLGHPQATYMSHQLFLLLACLKLPLRDNIPKNSFWRFAKMGEFYLQYLLQADKGQQTLPIKGNCLSYFFLLGLI